MKNPSIKKALLIVKILCVFCGLLQAAELSDERVQLLAKSDQIPIYSGEQWHTKIKRSLAQNEVEVFSFPKKRPIHSVTYDVSSTNTGVILEDGRKKKRTICPTLYALQQEYLHGCIVKVGRPAPMITGVDFCARDASLEDCWRKSFFSGVLDAFVSRSCRSLAVQGRELPNCDGEKLTAAMLNTMQPEFKKFRWKIVQEAEVLKILQAKEKQPDVLLMIGGVGFLKGSLTRSARCLLGPNYSNKRSLFSYKIGECFDDICERHPFSIEEYKFCINNKSNVFLSEDSAL